MVDATCLELEAFQISPVYDKKGHKKSTKPKIKIVKLSHDEAEIDFIGFHTSLVNAYRRIILAEVPTMAIEKVYMYFNSSIMQDEVLAHRLGLVPLSVDPRLFEFRTDATSDWGPQDTVKYELRIKCERNRGSSSVDPDHAYTNRKVFTSSLKWRPIGDQESTFPANSLVPLHDDILLAKLNPGHEIHLEAFAVKGIGSDHAKFQPGTAWYRLLPEIDLTREVEGNEAHLLQSCFSPGVISLETTEDGKTVAAVNDARNDSCSRNVFQYDSIKDSVKLTRRTDHIIFYVESQSFLSSMEILESAVTIMSSKCSDLLNELNKFLRDENEDSE